MRIWHEQLIPKLCQKHLCAMWREGLGAYSIITNNKRGYRNHPAVKEFENAPINLWWRLTIVRDEMIFRGYHPKRLGLPVGVPRKYTQADIWRTIRIMKNEKIKEWQSLDEQIKILKSKKCQCKV